MSYHRYPHPGFAHTRTIAASGLLLLLVAALTARADSIVLPRVEAHGRAAGSAAPAAQGGQPHGVLSSTTLVVNEIDYDQSGSDTAEFLELKNVSAGTINLDPYEVRLVTGDTGTVYKTIALPNVDLAAGDYYVVCGNAATVANCDLDVSPNSDLIQNGAPDAVAVADSGGIVDTVSYEGDSPGGYTEGSGSGLVDSGANAAEGISRYSDGTDTDQNNADLAPHCISPGETNLGTSGTCGSPTATATPTTAPPTATPDSPTATPDPPTATPEPPTATPVPPTATPEAPTETAEAPTETPVPPTATLVPPTATPEPPTATPVPPTNTMVPPTASPVPPSATPVPTATPVEDPLAVELATWRARRVGTEVYLYWATLSETDHAGFLVWRRGPDGRLTRVTPRLVPPRGNALRGAYYVLRDRGAPTGATRYWLADIDTRGRATWHGPLRVPAVRTPDGIAPDVIRIPPSPTQEVPE
jgi:hypothetical protein